MQEQVNTSQDQHLTLTIPASAPPEIRAYLESLGCSFHPIEDQKDQEDREEREQLDFPVGTQRIFQIRLGVSERHVVQLPNQVMFYETYDTWRGFSVLAFDKEGHLAFLHFQKQQQQQQK